jgi:hypothetical protein
MTNYIGKPIPQKASKRLAAILGSMLIVIACSLGLASQAHALALLEGDQYFLGYINPDIPTDPADATSYINKLITLAINDTVLFSGQTITRSDNTLCGPSSCPTATTTNDVLDTTKNNTGDFGSGFQYLLAKYDAEQGGALVWYVDGLTGSFSVPQNFGTCGDSGCGLSHFDLYTGTGPGPGDPGPGTTQEVPEPTSMLLLGSGVMLVNLVGRRIRRRSK